MYRIAVANLGKEHPNVAEARVNLGSVYEKRAYYPEALREYKITNLFINLLGACKKTS